MKDLFFFIIIFLSTSTSRPHIQVRNQPAPQNNVRGSQEVKALLKAEEAEPISDEDRAP